MTKNKYESMIIKKKCKKNPPYRCCFVSGNNKTKPSRQWNCTYPQWYKRMDVKNAAIAEVNEIMSYKNFK